MQFNWIVITFTYTICLNFFTMSSKGSQNQLDLAWLMWIWTDIGNLHTAFWWNVLWIDIHHARMLKSFLCLISLVFLFFAMFDCQFFCCSPTSSTSGKFGLLEHSWCRNPLSDWCRVSRVCGWCCWLSNHKAGWRIQKVSIQSFY